MTSFPDLDPTSADDPRLDPSSDTARAARAAAIVRGDDALATSSRTPRPRRRLVPALAATGAAAAVALGVVLAGGSDGTPPDALAQAADETAQAATSSGVVTVTQQLAEADGTQAASSQVVKFDGADVSMLAVTEATPAGGGDATRTEREDVVVDGQHYVRKDGDGFVVKTGETEGDAGDLRAFIAGETDNRALADLVRGDEDVRQDGDSYTASVSRGDLAGLERAPLGLKDAPADWGDELPVTLTVRDGLIAKVAVRIPKGVLSTEFSGLGEPQTIEAPAAG